MKKNLLALDLGKGSLGIAISRSGMFITPIENFRFHAMCFQEPLNRIKELLLIERVETFVLGLPLFPSGDPCEMTEIVYSFAKMLQENFPEIEIVYQDERYSTIEASNNLSKVDRPHSELCHLREISPLYRSDSRLFWIKDISRISKDD